MQFPRSSGILLHITSLPSRSGVGDLGPDAIAFVDFLAKAGQSVWQVLPLGPPALGNSPYSCYSAFAGSPLLISLEQMVQDGWLKLSELSTVSDGSSPAVDFAAVAADKHQQFQTAFTYSRELLRGNRQFAGYCREQSWWLDDFARFDAMMRHFDDPDWTHWPTGLVQRDQGELKKWDALLADQIQFAKFLQFVFAAQWDHVKRYANQRGIRIFGDMPIFVAHESADVWANQSLFCLDELGRRTLVAGVPPDYFSATGQLWGNPLYRWDVLESTDYAWWTARFGAALRQFDILRVDHFRGFESYWEIPASAVSALSGQWREGPKAKPFEAARRALGELPIVAEDLGMITEAVHQLRDQLGFPAMRVLQFGFDDENDVFHRPDHYPQHSVAYTGTHDNDTIMGWYQKRLLSRDPETADPLRAFLSGDQDIHLQLIQAVLNSASDTAVVPMQDVLGLGNEARMNLPGEAKGNWAWRVDPRALTDQLASQLNAMTKQAKR
jgi:4-alpha-glucanotransferase